MIGEPTIADAILDRIIHNAHRIEIKGDSMRRTKNTPDLTRHQKRKSSKTKRKSGQGLSRELMKYVSDPGNSEIRNRRSKQHTACALAQAAPLAAGRVVEQLPTVLPARHQNILDDWGPFRLDARPARIGLSPDQL